MTKTQEARKMISEIQYADRVGNPELAARARRILAKVDPEPPVSANPAPWLAWRHRQMMVGSALI